MPPKTVKSIKADKLSTFLINLSEKATTMKLFRANPVAVMTKAGLSTDEQNLVLTKNAVSIKSAILKNRGLIVKDGRVLNIRGGSVGETVVVVVVIVIIL